ncbi:MAG: AgrD family cyclic lactone autoinducer peptide, partial [Streptosporangiaceae bacterium]
MRNAFVGTTSGTACGWFWGQPDAPGELFQIQGS